MAAPQRPTLGEIVYRVAVRCGYAGQGGASGIQRPIMKDFVQSAQTQLIEQYHDTVLRIINDDDPGTLTTGATLYDIPDNAPPDDFKEIRLLTLEGDASYPQLVRGITHAMRAYTERRRPTHYEIRRGTSEQPQIEVWPEPDADYPIRMEYFMRPTKFEDDDDRATVDGELVFLHALTAAKAHYRQPDAEAISAQLNALLSKLKTKQHQGRRYFKHGFNSAKEPTPIHIPPRRV